MTEASPYSGMEATQVIALASDMVERVIPPVTELLGALLALRASIAAHDLDGAETHIGNVKAAFERIAEFGKELPQ